MNTMVRLLVLAAAAVLGACTANSYCAGVQPYQEAPSVAPVQGTGDLKFPESPSALRIPPAPANPVPYGQKVKDADGDEVLRCLDKPPEMPPPAEPKPGVTAPAAAPAGTPPAAPAGTPPATPNADAPKPN